MGGISLGLGVIGAGISSWKAGEARNAIEGKNSILTNQRAERENIFNKQFFQDITQRTDVQNLFRMLSENQKKQKQLDDASNAVSGASRDQQLAAQDSRSRNFADAWSQVANSASQLKDQYLGNWQNYLDSYYANRLGLQNELANTYTNESNQWSSMADNAFKTGSNLMGSGLDKIIS